jgi:glyoxylase-like metal-dependent hydrolase (beta-lactamase superfamily II)
MLQENCYVVSDETKECVIIDCGAFYPEEHTSELQSRT